MDATYPSEIIDPEADQIFGRRPDSVVRLAHASATSGVWRVNAGAETCIVKMLVPPGGHDPETSEATSFRYWLREDHIYGAGLPQPYLSAGIRAARLLARFDHFDRSVTLWLEDVLGTSGAAWDLPAFAEASRRLGRAQGGYLAGRSLPWNAWLSQSFLRNYLAGRPAQFDEFLTSDVAWDQPSIARHFDPGLRGELRRLRADRERLLGWVESAPRTFAHLDFWPENLFMVGDDLVVIDWSHAGIGAGGEDPGNLIPDSVFDMRHPASSLPEMDRTVTAAYLAGLQDAGWEGDERIVRLAMTASACKYDWIAGATLSRATGEPATQTVYGGVHVSLEQLVATRAEALRYLVGRADEARRLAAELGLEG